MNVYMHDIAYAVGRRESISTIERLAADPELLGRVRDLGFAYYRRSDRTHFELAAEAIGETFRNSAVDVSDIDTFIYAPASRGLLAGGEFLRFTESLGLARATPIGVSLAECANFGSALRIARSFVAAGEARAVLVATGDVVRGDQWQRVQTDALTVLSDGAASCVITSSAQSRIEVLGVSQGTNEEIRTVDGQELELTRQVISQVADELFARVGVDRDDIRAVVPNNINAEIGRYLTGWMGMDHSLCYLDNISDFGHVNSADNLINLKTFLEDGVAPGDIVMTISHGYSTWGVSLLRIH